MKGISLHQPYATFIAMKWKKIETRYHSRFKCLVGERIAIHAAKKVVPITSFMCECLPLNGTYHDIVKINNIVRFMEMCRGKILCTALVTRARWAPNIDFDFRKEWNKQAMCEVAGKFLLFLDEIEPIDPIPFRGHQGIFNVPDELLIGGKNGREN